MLEAGEILKTKMGALEINIACACNMKGYFERHGNAQLEKKGEQRWKDTLVRE